MRPYGNRNASPAFHIPRHTSVSVRLKIRRIPYAVLRHPFGPLPHMRAVKGGLQNTRPSTAGSNRPGRGGR